MLTASEGYFFKKLRGNWAPIEDTFFGSLTFLIPAELPGTPIHNALILLPTISRIAPDQGLPAIHNDWCFFQTLLKTIPDQGLPAIHNRYREREVQGMLSTEG